MGKDTDIQWCDSTVNPNTGCDGCELWPLLEKLGLPERFKEKAADKQTRQPERSCYAGYLHEGRLAKAMPHLYAASFTEVRLAPGRMAEAASWSDLTGKDRPDKPWLNGMPRMIFVGDMGDIFSKAVPFEYLESELIDIATSKQGSRHIWMLLTKQPRRMVEFQAWLEAGGRSWPRNVWAGTSITLQKTLANRYPWLAKMNAVRYLSVEPMLEAIDFYGVINDENMCYCNECGRRDRLNDNNDGGDCRHCGSICVREGRCGVDLVIFGGESDQRKHKARTCQGGWIRSGLSQFEHVASRFVKQLGSAFIDEINGVCGRSVKLHADIAGHVDRLSDLHGGDPSEWPADLRVREFPSVKVMA